MKVALRWLSEAVETIVPAVLIAVLINLFLAQATRVYGQSMEPNLHSDQRLVVEKLSYTFHEPQRGDIIILNVPRAGSGLLIKRVIGLPGEKVEIKGGRVYINEQAVEESYLSNQAQRDMKVIVVPPKHVFVLGDNRGFSNDSRSFGAVPLDNIVGRAWFSYWPLDQVGFLE
ncbi:MAG: signal peptidase I [Anaerolineales bacterium]|nr:signal peptidase I [Anaerolineales bacterium]